MGPETTVDVIAIHAQARPDALAVLNQGAAITWRQFHQDIMAACAGLAALGVCGHTRVALVCPDPYLHWLLVLACEQLGAVSDALAELQNEEWPTLDQRADLVLTTTVLPARPPCTTHVLSTDWLQRQPCAPFKPARVAADAPARVARSSGTTGRPRRMLLTRRDVTLRARSWQGMLNLKPSSRYLLTMQIAASTACYQASACCRAGAVLVLSQPVIGWRVLDPDGITHLFALPGLLDMWLSQIPAASPKPAALHVFCGGAHLSAALRQRVLERLAVSVTEVYASNEAGVVASTTGGAAGALTLHENCHAEVVDDSDAPLPPGDTGDVRLRSPSMAHAYLDGVDSTAHFRDGWFYPGDLGAMNNTGQLCLTGRSSDVMNLGGVKVHPESIEAALTSERIPADELAVCALPDAQGVDEVWVALSGQAAARQAEVVQLLQPVAQRYWWARFRVVKLPVVNPNAPGKLSRQALRSELAALRERSA